MMRLSIHRRGFFAALLAALLVLEPGHSTADEATLALKVKATYLFNLIRFVHWPAERIADGHFQLCVIGEDPLTGIIERLGGRAVKGWTIEVVHEPAASDACPMLYIARSEAKRLAPLLKRFSGPRLTVADIADFTRSGGIVGFTINDGQVAIRINPARAKRAGLEISAQLLEIAELVNENESRSVPLLTAARENP